MFGSKKKVQQVPQSQKEANPFLNARRSMNERVGFFMEKIRAWQIMAVMEFALILALLALLNNFHNTPKYIPYVVELDKMGVVVNTQYVKMGAVADERIMKSTIASFITNVRMVTPDIELQRKAVRSVFAHLTSFDPARRVLEKWYSVDPGIRSRDVIVSTEIQSILLQGKTTWQVEWVENTRNHAGDLIDTQNYRALINVYQAELPENASEESIRLNPLSIYIKDLSWAKIVR